MYVINFHTMQWVEMERTLKKKLLEAAKDSRKLLMWA